MIKTRRNTYGLKIFFYVIIAILIQNICYAIPLMRTHNIDGRSIWITLGCMTFVPIACALILKSSHKHEAPVSSAFAVNFVLFTILISALAALRISLSFYGLLFAFMGSTIVQALLNINFAQLKNHRIGVVDFCGTDELPESLKLQIEIIKDPNADVNQFDIIITDTPMHKSAEWSEFIKKCYLSGTEMMNWSRFMEVSLQRVDVKNFKVSHIAYSPAQLLYVKSKRLVDLILVMITLPLTLPIAALVALYIYMRDGGPVLFIQERKGQEDKPFPMYKFRTMYNGTDGKATQKKDSRIIPGVGILRRLRVDELPQIWNILKGDMTLIGPRPVANYVAQAATESEPKFVYRTLVTPGISGWAQVKQGYASTTEEELAKLSYDLYYIKHMSFDLDVQIFFATIKTVFFGTGAR